MKKNNFLFLLLLCSFTTLSYAQKKTEKVDIIWGEEQKQSNKIKLDNIIGNDESGIYAIKETLKFSGKGPIYIERYDPNMKLSKSVEITLGEKNEDRYYKSAAQLDGELLIFSEALDKKTKRRLLFVQSVDKQSLLPSEKLVQIGEISYAEGSKKNSGTFGFEISNDEKRILVYYDLPYEEKEKVKVSYHIFDNQLNKLWGKDITLPYIQELFQVADYEINDKGDLYILSKLYKDKAKDKRKGKPNYQYLVLAYTDKGNTETEFPISIQEHFLTDMQVAINDQGEIICGGFYSEEGTFSIKGSYFLKIDGQTKQVVSKSFKEFSTEFITQNMTDRQEKKVKKKEEKGKDVELFAYVLDDIVLRNDGGAVLIGEQYFVRESTYTNSQGQVYTNFHYFYNDIIVVNLSPTGQIDWTEKIAKRQHSINDGGYYSSYSLAVVEDRLFFVFNDNVKNLFGSKAKGKIESFTKKEKESVAVLVEVDLDGRQVKEAMFSAKETELLIRPKVCKQISDNELIIYGQKKKYKQFGKITFLD